MFFSLADRDKPAGLVAARRFAELGFALVATAGTADALEAEGIRVDAVVGKLGESDASGVDAVELISSGKVDLVVNTPRGRPARPGRRRPHPPGRHRAPCVRASPRSPPPSRSRRAWPSGVASEPQVRSLQEYHRDGQLRLEV